MLGTFREIFNRPMKTPLLLILTPVLALLTPVLHTLNGLSISSFGIGGRYVLLVIGAIAFIYGVLLATLAQIARKRAVSSARTRTDVTAALQRQSLAATVSRSGHLYRIAQALLLALVVAVSIDLMIGGRAVVLTWYALNDESRGAAKALAYSSFFVPVLISCYLTVTALRENSISLLFAIYGAMFAYTFGLSALVAVQDVKKPSASTTNFASNAAAPVAADASLPPIIHIVFDEMIGADGIDRELPGGEDAYHVVSAFQQRFGYRTYAKAFSRHYLSAISIPNLLNFDYLDDTYGANSKYTPRDIVAPGKIVSIKYFDEMRAAGYRIAVTQTVLIDFCSAVATDQCHTFDSFDPQNEYIDTAYREHKTRSRVRLETLNIVDRAMSDSITGALLGWRLVNRLNDAREQLIDRYDLHGFDNWFNVFAERVLVDGPGTLNFAHFLVPHAPHLLDRNCRVQEGWINPYYLKETKGLSGSAFSEAREAHFVRYFDQLICVYSKMTDLMVRLEASPRHANAIIVFHGDHGARISSGRFLENLQVQDYIDNYSTAFSIKGPHIEAGFDMRKVSIQRLFAEYFSHKDLAELAPDFLETVSVEVEKDVRTSQGPMPDFGAPLGDWPTATPDFPKPKVP